MIELTRCLKKVPFSLVYLPYFLNFSEGDCDPTGTKLRGEDGTCICHKEFSGAQCAICAEGYAGNECEDCAVHYFRDNGECLGNCLFNSIFYVG